MKVLGNVSVIVLGIVVASYGEIAFVFMGFVFQACGIIFESIRLVMVQKLLSSAEYKMDPLVSLYYFAPVCLLETLLTIGLRGYECYLLHHLRRTKVECPSCIRCRIGHALHECRSCILSQRRCRLPRTFPRIPINSRLEKHRPSY
jgi:hypothetical protein